jgi:hypothetical protein
MARRSNASASSPVSPPSCSAGHGAKGRRLYDWTRVKLAAPATTGMARWLLVCRWPDWYRHVILALLAHAFLAVTRAPRPQPRAGKGDTAA